MTEQQVNIPLLRKAVEWAEAEAAKPPELCEWRQVFWVSAREYTPAWGAWVSSMPAEKDPECGTCYCIAGYVVATEVGPTPHDVPALAASLLGLTEYEAGPLFSASNSIEDVRRIAEEIAEERL